MPTATKKAEQVKYEKAHDHTLLKFDLLFGQHHERVQTGHGPKGEPLWEIRHYKKGDVIETPTDLKAVDRGGPKFKRSEPHQKPKYPGAIKCDDGKLRLAHLVEG